MLRLPLGEYRLDRLSSGDHMPWGPVLRPLDRTQVLIGRVVKSTRTSTLQLRPRPASPPTPAPTAARPLPSRITCVRFRHAPSSSPCLSTKNSWRSRSSWLLGSLYATAAQRHTKFIRRSLLQLRSLHSTPCAGQITSLLAHPPNVALPSASRSTPKKRCSCF
jgi:hypothetical protein